MKRCSFIDRTFSPNLPTMPLDDAMDSGETHPDSRKFRVGMQPLKRPE
jgi:hypothetical protein